MVTRVQLDTNTRGPTTIRPPLSTWKGWDGARDGITAIKCLPPGSSLVLPWWLPWGALGDLYDLCYNHSNPGSWRSNYNQMAASASITVDQNTVFPVHGGSVTIKVCSLLSHTLLISDCQEFNRKRQTHTSTKPSLCVIKFSTQPHETGFITPATKETEDQRS